MVLLKPTLLVLLGVFLVAILLHMFLLRKEFFVDIRTPLDKDNVKKAVDDVILDLLSYYQKLKDSNSNDPRIKYRLLVLTQQLNSLNENYPTIANVIQNFDYSKVPPAITVSELNTVKNFLTQRVGAVASPTITTPADLTDLDLLSNRIQALFDMAQQKAQLAGFPASPQVGIEVQTLRETLKKLKLDLPTMKPQDINILKIDQYIPALFLTMTKFSIPPTMDSFTTYPPLTISNLPTPTTAIASLAAPITQPSSPSAPTPIIPSSTPTMQLATPSGLKFSELVQTLLSYSPMAAPGQISPGLSASGPLGASPNAKLTSTTADLLSTPSDAVLTGSNAPSFFDKIRGIVREEVHGQMGSNVVYTPKDVQSAKVANRSTDSVTTDTPDAKSDALQQGQWFRQDQGCPYAASQAGGNPMPYPIDMNDYIRKDSIPCYGCTL